MDARLRARVARLQPDGRQAAIRHPSPGWLVERSPPSCRTDGRSPAATSATATSTSTSFRFGGSIGAEHGIGRSKKRAFLERVDPVTLDLLRAVKGALDPDGLMSRGRIFDGPAGRRTR